MCHADQLYDGLIRTHSSFVELLYLYHGGRNQSPFRFNSLQNRGGTQRGTDCGSFVPCRCYISISSIYQVVPSALDHRKAEGILIILIRLCSDCCRIESSKRIRCTTVLYHAKNVSAYLFTTAVHQARVLVDPMTNRPRYTTTSCHV